MEGGDTIMIQYGEAFGVFGTLIFFFGAYVANRGFRHIKEDFFG